MLNPAFNLLREETLSEVNGRVRLFEHKKTKAQILSICNDDENKSFGVTFRTPPKNSTGVAHILEHSVLCGSEKYPVKEPFVELLKSSLQTFLNAMTFPDKTTYPVASTNLQDFYNLIDVYVDAVFYPRITENTLAQEGWHIHAENTDIDTWIYKGVVFNEMKGVYSSPDSVLAEQTQQAVFPDNIYNLDSGGNPEEILNLSFEEFKEFHDKYYHPTNSRFFFWGDDPEEARLEILEKLLAPFEAIELNSSVALQKPLDYERKIESLYAFESDEEEINGKNSHVTVSWLLCEGKEAEEVMILEMLEHILIGLAGSPLRKALMDSGLGEDVTGVGLETDLRQTYFSIGLRSIAATDGDKTELLVMDTLAGLYEDGLEQKIIDSAISAMEFSLRENNTGTIPRGLSAMIQSLSTWLYDEDPLLPLAWEKPLASIKARLATGEKLFENAIKKYFLDNMHRVCLVLHPDESLAEALEEKEKNRLLNSVKDLSEAEKLEVVKLAEALEEAQEREDSPEALATIPTLSLEDIPVTGKLNPLEVAESGEPTVLHHEIDTTGILYTRILLPITNLSKEELPLLSLYCRALTEMGTTERDFVDLGLEISAQTGGLDVSGSVHTKVDADEPYLYLKVFGKAVEEKIPALANLMQEILCKPNFQNKERFMQMVWEEKARYEQGIVPAGHNLLASYLGGMFSKSGHLSEIMGGVPYWNFIRKFAQNIEEDFEKCKQALENLHQKVICAQNAVISLTGTAPLLQKGQIFKDLVQALPTKQGQDVNYDYAFAPKAAGLIVPAQVNYVGLAGNLKETGYAFHGSSHVITRFLRMGYLWDRVRVQGGAYGCFVRYARNSGNFLFASYRDPNVERTIKVYSKAAEYLGNLNLTQAELTKSIVGAMGDVDSYRLPSAKGNAALWEYISGYTPEMQAKNREEVLGTTLADFHNFAPYLQKLIDNATPAALGGPAVTEYGQSNNWELIKLL